MSRSILHVDMNAFFVSVELLDRPDLRGQPVVVGGGGARGVVAAASYEARQFGIHSAMSSAEALRRCPHAVFLPANHQKYSEVSTQVRHIFDRHSSLVEPISIDEAFLDVTLAAPTLERAGELAHAIRVEVREHLNLTCSVGVASNKFVAKLASVDAKPVATRQAIDPGPGVVTIALGTEDAYVGSLAVRRLWGVGPKTAERLSRIGVRSVLELRAVPVEVLESLVGVASARHLREVSYGRDDRPVISDRDAKSIGHEETFHHDVAAGEDLHRELLRMTDLVTAGVRRSEGGARTWTVKIRFTDFSTISRSRTWKTPVDSSATVIGELIPLLDAAVAGRSVRLLGVSASGFGPMSQQLDFFSHENEATSGRDRAIDEIRDRFGRSALQRASTLRRSNDGPNRGSR